MINTLATSVLTGCYLTIVMFPFLYMIIILIYLVTNKK